jgi:[acyl-carrier-protein] S-malonyltransferase
METAREAVRGQLERATVRNAVVPVYTNVTARATTAQEDIAKSLIEQITGAVRWDASIIQMIADGAATFYEIGPGNVLAGLIKRIDKTVSCECIGKLEELEKFKA